MKIKKIAALFAKILLVVILAVALFYHIGYMRVGSGIYRPGEFFSGKVRDLALAAQRGNVAEINRLIKEGVDPNTVGEKSTTVLMWAVASNNEEGLEALLKNGANPNYIPPKGSEFEGESVTYLLAGGIKTNLLKIVLENGGDPNIRNPQRNNQTALMFAVDLASFKNVEILVEHGADINARDDKGLNALFHAVENRQFEKAYYLLEHGADYRISGYTYASLTQSSFLQELSDSRNWGFNEQGEAERAKVLKWFSDRNIQLPEKSY